MSESRFSKYDRDPEALAWAHAKVESVAKQMDEFEAKCRAKGDEDARRRWRLVAYMLRSKLAGPGEGCVITGFDRRLPTLVEALTPEQPPADHGDGSGAGGRSGGEGA